MPVSLHNGYCIVPTFSICVLRHNSPFFFFKKKHLPYFITRTSGNCISLLYGYCTYIECLSECYTVTFLYLTDGMLSQGRSHGGNKHSLTALPNPPSGGGDAVIAVQCHACGKQEGILPTLVVRQCLQIKGKPHFLLCDRVMYRRNNRHIYTPAYRLQRSQQTS